jgi:hypothetical protein
MVKDILIDRGIDPSVDNIQQLAIFLEALKLYNDRTVAYGQIWQQYGAMSNLLNVARKTDRLLNIWWTGDEEELDPDTGKPKPLLHKDNLDDAIDLLNYTAFFIRNARAANIHGSIPQRPQLVHREFKCGALYHQTTAGGYCPRCGGTWKVRHGR